VLAGLDLTIRWSAFGYYRSLKQLALHVLNHPDESLSLNDAAHIAGLNRSYFAEYFREKTGVTFKCWMDVMRVSHAARLLRESDISIGDGCREAGFQDPTTFARTFRRLIGLSPTQFRRRPHKPDKSPKLPD
jgi:AraC-like DNA-binding protein